MTLAHMLILTTPYCIFILVIVFISVVKLYTQKQALVKSVKTIIHFRRNWTRYTFSDP